MPQPRDDNVSVQTLVNDFRSRLRVALSVALATGTYNVMVSAGRSVAWAAVLRTVSVHSWWGGPLLLVSDIYFLYALSAVESVVFGKLSIFWFLLFKLCFCFGFQRLVFGRCFCLWSQYGAFIYILLWLTVCIEPSLWWFLLFCPVWYNVSFPALSTKFAFMTDACLYSLLFLNKF